jgi:hypothetical protein
MLFDPSRRSRKLMAGLLLAGLIGSGAAATTGAVASTSTAARPAVIKPAVSRSTVPQALTRAETAAEDVIGFLEKGQPAKSRAEARILRSLAHGAAAQELRRAGVSDAQVAAFQRQADRTARLSHAGAPALRISLAANGVSRLMPGFYARYQDPVPAAVLRLDYLDRQVQLRSMARQHARAQQAADQLAATWRKLRPQVIAAGGASVAQKYDGHVAKLTGSGGVAALQSEAQHGLDLVDQLEQVFLA